MQVRPLIAASFAALTVLATAGVTAGAAAPAEAAPTRTSARILFDNAHAETAGNADWIISTSQPDPFGQNASPSSETDWTGGISAWGVALSKYRTDYPNLKTNKSALTYGSTSNPLDLTNFDELVIPEPNTAFTAAERTAIVKFVQNGGGLFLIVDHDQSDRNNDGVDSVDIANQLFNSNGIDNTNPFGITVDYKNYSNENPSNIPTAAVDHPVMNGAWGRATGSIIRGGTTFTLSTASNSAARCMLFRNSVSNTGSAGCFVAISQFGSGRVVLWGDTSPVDDGTGQAGNTLYDGWNDPAGTNATLTLNATDWVGGLS